MPGHAWQNLSDALALSALWTKWLWVGLVLLIIFRWTKILGNKTVGKENAETPVFYASTALVTGIIAFLIYLWIAALPTQVWYYLPLMTFTAVCADAALQNWLTRWRIWRLLFACLIVGASFSGTLQMSQCRQTNVDLVVAELNERIEPNDLILVHPWYYGISFERYYKGKTPWTTLPPLEDYRFHRYDLFKVQMQMDDPIQPVLDKIAATLKSGNRVWLVGQIPLNPLPPPNLRPAPNNPWGWLDEPYSHIWGAQAGYFIANHAIQGTIITEHSVNCISPYENLPLILITGWR